MFHVPTLAETISNDRQIQKSMRYAAASILGQTEADDLVQTVNVKFLTHKIQFNGSSSLRTFVVQLTKNEALNYRRKQRGGMGRISIQLTTQDAPIRETQQEQSNKLDRIAKLYQTMKPKQRQIIDALKEGKDYATIAAELGMSLSNVKVTILRIRKAAQTL